MLYSRTLGNHNIMVITLFYYPYSVEKQRLNFSISPLSKTIVHKISKLWNMALGLIKQ